MIKDTISSGVLAFFSRQPVEIKAGALTLAAGLFTLMIHNSYFEQLSVALGIANIIPSAAPPIGYTGRGVIALMAAFLAGIAAYIYFTGHRSKKHRQRFDLYSTNPDVAAKQGKQFAERLRRGFGDTLAPKATQWDAKPTDADFNPLDVQRDLGAPFDESPYLQDSMLSYGEGAAHRDDGGVAIDPAMTPIPAPPHAEYSDLELDPASRLSDPKWRVRPVVELRDNVLDLGETEAIGTAPGDHGADEDGCCPEEAWMDLGLDAQSAIGIPETTTDPRAVADTSVKELLARLEGALVDRVARRAQMRLEVMPIGTMVGIDRNEHDINGALKDALAALQNAYHRP